MHQTFYIDVDEEITSAIDRLKKSKTKENIFVVPKRALILQSLVSLRLLKKEAEKSDKQIMIISQDEQGRSLAEKVGILSQQSLEGIEENEEVKIKVRPKIKETSQKDLEKKTRKKAKLESLGSEEFYEKEKNVKNSETLLKPGKIKNKKIFIKKIDDYKPVSDIVKSEKALSSSLKYHPSNISEEKEEEAIENYDKYRKVIDPRKEEELKEFFQFGKDAGILKKEPQAPASKKARNFFISFIIISIIIILSVGVFLIFPKAVINVQSLPKIKETDVEVRGDVNAVASNIENNTIPVRIIEKEKEKTSSFSASGKNKVSDQKSRGTIAIYNEYGTSPQSLVATTRFLSSDGKLFRLTKGVMVPGMIEVAGKLNPGVIEAEVVADQPGGEYNISSGSFSIPGFQGSSKYDKFYARSSNPMTGGGSNGSEVIVISQEDIDSAKKKIENELAGEIENEIKNELKNGEIFLQETTEKTVLESGLPEVGVITDTFNVKSKIKIKAMVFSEEELKNIIVGSFDNKKDEKLNSLKIEYGKSTLDFGTGTVILKIHGKASFDPIIDVDRLKNELLGKNEEQTKEVLKSYSQIKEVELEFWPKLFSKRIPRYEKRVEVKIIPSGFDE